MQKLTKKNLEKIKKKKIKCDICGKIIASQKFRVIHIYDTNKVNLLWHHSHDNLDKEIIGHNRCVENMNFLYISKELMGANQ